MRRHPELSHARALALLLALQRGAGVRPGGEEWLHRTVRPAGPRCRAELGLHRSAPLSPTGVVSVRRPRWWIRLGVVRRNYEPAPARETGSLRPQGNPPF